MRGWWVGSGMAAKAADHNLFGRACRRKRGFCSGVVSFTATSPRRAALCAGENGQGWGTGAAGGVARRTEARSGAEDGSDGHNLHTEGYSGKEILTGQ